MNNHPDANKMAKKTSLLTKLFGKIHWSSPPWFKAFNARRQRSPRWFFTGLLALVGLLIGAIFLFNWYQHLPKPILVSMQVKTPGITPLNEELEPEKLSIQFGTIEGESGAFKPSSVAPLAQLNKEIKNGVTLTPDFPGTWQWNSDGQSLFFLPAKDWPAGQNFHIEFSKGFFAENAKMASYSASFRTKPFTAKISEWRLYQDPVDPNLKEAVATMVFNFPVDAQSLKDKISLVLQENKAGKSKPSSSQLPFKLEFDKHNRKAYLHSKALQIEKSPRYLLLTIDKGVKALSGRDASPNILQETLLVPDASTYFKLTNLNASIIRNEQDRPEQILNVEMSLGTTEKALSRALHVYLLPKDKAATKFEKESLNHTWTSPGEVTPEVLAEATSVALVALPSERNYMNLHSYKFQADASRYLLVKLDKGTTGFGGFKLAKDYLAVMKAPELPKEISFLHKGALLALSSEKKLSVLVRGLSAVKFEIARVLPDNVNQLVTQTEGDFNNPYFMNQSFKQQNISQIFSEIQNFDATFPGKQNYTALNIEKYLKDPSNREGPKGLFLLQATGWDPANNVALEVKSNRLILVTDMAMIVKDNSDASHDVFVQSISTGQALAQVLVKILGKNGLPIASGMSDANGHVSFPNLKEFIEEKEPSVYLAEKGADVSFVPYNKLVRGLNLSRFDVGGIYTGNAAEMNSLSAYMFSDRGVYRPGDRAHIAMIVKNSFAKKAAPGVPLQATITDPRGMTVFDEKYTLNDSGFLDFDYKTRANSPTGMYYATLYTVKDEHPDNYLGTTSFRVSEFQPDRMRIRAVFSKALPDAWVSPDNLTAKVNLWNLYGAPAANRRISAKIFLSPEALKFKEHPDYVFIDPLLNPAKPPKVYSDSLAEVSTNESGDAILNPKLERFEEGTYQLRLVAEGFEADGGRSVSTEIQTLVSPRSFFIGYKADGDLNYIQQNAQSSIHFLAIGPSLKPLALKGLKVQLFSLEALSTLIKKDNGTYQYQSIIKPTLLNESPFALNETGANYALPTANIGDYELKILDSKNLALSRLKFRTVGASQRPMSRNAELNLVLNKEEYEPGEEIELQISAPYAGTGLISIERDKVYAYQWFKADTNNSIQKITVPKDLQGDAYVNVALVRDWNSPEVFVSPLSYSVLPFKLNHKNQAIQIDLETPALAEPGENYRLRYKTDRPAKIIVYAVDEGILQVSKYQTPDPLAFFFQKHALEVLTQQTVDQILPNYVEKRELSSVGGDGSDNELSLYLNPFKRKTDEAVVYWSGIQDSDQDLKDLEFQVPDYFNGKLRLMAVAVSEDALGHAEKSSEVRGNFIISPNVPSFVAPQDLFEITASIANNVKGSGKDAKVRVELNASEGLEILDAKNQAILIPEGQEKTLRFKVRAKELLGAAQLDFHASLGDKSSNFSSSLSIRPASAFIVSLTSGHTQKTSLQLPLVRNLLADMRQVEALASTSPLILVQGLQRYLNNYPYGCTEQLVSKAFPLLALGVQSASMDEKAKINQKIADTIAMLGQRQLSNGGFSFWPNSQDNANIGFISSYAMHFLSEARALNYAVPNELYFAGIAYLKELASGQANSLESARLKAYAIYLLTRNEIVTTAYLTGLQLYLDKNEKEVWKKDITGAYIAAAYQLLKSEEAANALIGQYQIQNKSAIATDFFDANVADAQYLYLLAEHFPDRLENAEEKLVMPLVNAMNTEEMNTVLSSYISLALNAYSKSTAQSPTSQDNISIFEQWADKTLVKLGKADEKLSISDKTISIKLANPDAKTVFYQLTESGFDVPKKQEAVKQGIEIFREYKSNNAPLEKAILGQEIEVHIQARALDNRSLSNIAIVDLLPGGFEVVLDSVAKDSVDYADVREDRVVFFTSLSNEAKEIVYRIKATNTGTFTVPPIMAESMYNPGIRARGELSSLRVNSPKS